MEHSMYDTLLQLPLFQGLCKDDFTTIIEKVKFHFLSYKENEIICKQGDPCKQLVFLLSGEITLKVTDEEEGYTLSETLHAPHIIEPYSLFGMDTHYTATYLAKTDATLLTINKAYVNTELHNYEIFRINYLNILSNRIQVSYKKLWSNHMSSLNEKFIHFLLNRCQKPQGEKMLHTTMEDLARMVSETRINVSKMLNDMQQQGLVQLKRKEIYIPALEKLTESLI